MLLIPIDGLTIDKLRMSERGTGERKAAEMSDMGCQYFYIALVSVGRFQQQIRFT